MGVQSHTQVAPVNLPLRFLQAYLEAQDLETLIQPQFWKDSNQNMNGRNWACPACPEFLRLGNLTCATVLSWRFCRQAFSFTLAEFCNEVEEGTRTTTACQCFACSTMRHVTYSRFRCPKWFLNEEPSNRTGDRVASESTKVICSRILKGGVSMSRRTGCSSDFKSTQTCPSLHTHCTLMCLNCCWEDSSAARLSTMPMLGFIFATLAWSARSPGFQKFPGSFTATKVRESSIEGTSNLVDEVCPWTGTYGADGPKSYVLWRSMRDDAEGHHLSKWWFLC